MYSSNILSVSWNYNRLLIHESTPLNFVIFSLAEEVVSNLVSLFMIKSFHSPKPE